MRTAALILFFLPFGTDAQTFTGKVTHITDGDTFTLLLDDTDSTVSVNLYCVDCPELGQDYGAIAKRFTYDLIFNRYVTVVQPETDPSGAISGIVYVGTHSINEAILRAGMGWHYNLYHKNPDWDALQDMAKKGKTGLWKASYKPPVPPWEFRPGVKVYRPQPRY